MLYFLSPDTSYLYSSRYHCKSCLVGLQPHRELGAIVLQQQLKLEYIFVFSAISELLVVCPLEFEEKTVVCLVIALF